MDPNSFSIKGGMDGAVVLLTGVTGFLGSCILEQLLRCSPNVQEVYVLVRGKGSLLAEDRIKNLLDNSILFKSLRDSTVDWPSLTSKVLILQGDLEPEIGSEAKMEAKHGQPSIGSTKIISSRISHLFCFHAPSSSKTPHPPASSTSTSTSTSSSSLIPEEILPRITHVIHCAARIALEDNIQVTLTANYMGTKKLLDLCTKMSSLTCFCYISSAFSNINQPWGSVVTETIYPLMLGDREVDAEDQVSRIMSLSPSAAGDKAAALMKLWGFPNTYTLGKALTERLVRDRMPSLPSGARAVIMRPSFIGALTGAPLRGYTGNLAGPSGAAVAYGIGFHLEGGSAWANDSLLDCLPVDMVSSLVIAATTLSGAKHPLSLGQSPGSPWIVHCCSSTTNPIFNLEAHRLAYDFFSKHPAKRKVISGPYPPPRIDYVVDQEKVARCTKRVERRVKLLVWALNLGGKKREAKKLSLGLQQWKEANSAKSNIQLFFSSDSALEIERIMIKEEAEEFVVVWRGSWKDWSDDYLTFVLERFMGGGKGEKSCC